MIVVVVVVVVAVVVVVVVVLSAPPFSLEVPRDLQRLACPQRPPRPAASGAKDSENVDPRPASRPSRRQRDAGEKI